MKKINLRFVGSPASSLGTPTNPPTGSYQNMNVNAVGSKYANTYGHETTNLIAKFTRKEIYDASPAQYNDLKILKVVGSKHVTSDEIFYSEMSYGREPIVIGTIAAPIASGSSQVIPVLDTSVVSVDTLVVLPNSGGRGNVTNVNQAANTITVTAETGSTLPTLQTTASGETIANIAPVEADGVDSISQYFRSSTIERCNYVQLLVKAMRYGKMEIYKYQNNGNLPGFLAMEKKSLLQQMRTDLSNVYWNGNMAEVTLANGMKAKTAGGIFPIMQAAGSPFSQVTLANLPEALEDLALNTEFNDYGSVKFCYATSRVILALSKKYKSELTRYNPDSMIAKLNLKEISIGSTRIVFVPMQRFEDKASFPPEWKNRLFLLDQASIQPCHIFPEEQGTTNYRGKNRDTLNTYIDQWISTTFSLEFYNPLGCGWLEVTDI